MIYLDNAATSNPKPYAVKKAVWNALSNAVNVGRNSSRQAFYYADKILSVRENIGKLMARKHYYFVPFGQDDPHKKPTSMIADYTQIPQALQEALAGRQIQPILL